MTKKTIVDIGGEELIEEYSERDIESAFAVIKEHEEQERTLADAIMYFRTLDTRWKRSNNNALQIWKKLATKCGEAVKYYDEAGVGKDTILVGGKANFDTKCTGGDDKPHFRTDYYVSWRGSMRMHLLQNLEALRHCFKDEIPQSLLLVDFGCGPMTAGLALAEVLSEKMSDYEAHTSYFGIDMSRQMVNKACSINNQHRLFAPERFSVVQGTHLDLDKIPDSFHDPQIAVLCLSFVLAPGTYKSDDVLKLADVWKTYVENLQQCRETRIIYLNPKSTEDYGLHNNWRRFRDNMLATSNANRFCYNTGGFTQRFVKLLKSNVSIEIIRGGRK